MVIKKFFTCPKNILLFLIFLVFAIFSSYIAVKLQRAIIPDEPYHITLSQHFEDSWSLPSTSPTNYPYIVVNKTPYLYYWINGRALNILKLIIPDISNHREMIFLRFINVVYSFLTIYFTYLLSQRIIRQRWGQIFAVFLMANTLMFVFLSSGVNYDNLINLCSIAAIYFLVRLYQDKNFIKDSLFLLISICIGSLSKISMLPLATIFGIIWVILCINNLRKNKIEVRFDPASIFLTTIVTILVILNLTLYLGNLINYQKITPACAQVLPEDTCNINPIARRDSTLQLPEKLSILDTINGKYMDPIEYTLDYWIVSMTKRIIGFMGHKSYFPDFEVTLFRLLFLWIIAVSLYYPKKHPPIIIFFGIISIIYIGIIWYLNFNNELITGYQHVAIQGRYIFPVIGIIYTLLGYFITNIPNKQIRVGTTIAFSLLFLFTGPIGFFFRIAPTLQNWFFT